MPESCGAFGVYPSQELEDMTANEIYKVFRQWWDFDTMEVAIGRPSVLKGLLVKIAELRRGNATLRGQPPEKPCKFCGDTGIIPTVRSVAGPDGDEIVSYNGQPCHLCEEKK